MSERVAIVSIAQTKYEREKPLQDHGELVWEVVKKVREETGLKYVDQVSDGMAIDKVVSCSEDFWQLRTISDAYIQPELGCYNMDSTKVAGDGAQAVYHAFMNILSGMHDIILVVAHRKESETIRNLVENAAFDPIFMRPLGLDFLAAAAMQMRRYMDVYGITEEQCAAVVVKNRGNAKKNPCAQEPLDLTTADVLESKRIAYPIKAFDCKPISDGACAMILASENMAKKLTDKPVWIKGVGNCYDAHYLGDRDLADCDSLRMAAQRAYKMAGITNPRQEIDLAEVSDGYSYQELLWLEEMGFCERGEGGKLIDQGITMMEGELPVNPSGGILSGNPSAVSGLTRVAEAALQLRGEAGERQVDGPGVALAQGSTGPCGQSQCVIILGN